jgi:hypothetical protein
MKINRHNYEEFFILYMDNELAPADRRMVEEFVQLHPDLKEELDLLLQFKLTPDTNVVFAGKEELMKGQPEPVINLSNYEEYLLLYTDNELSASEKTAVERFAAENLAVKKELDLLTFTRLQPETIEFPDKASLYRTEEKVRALPVRWWRAAAAILILGLGLTTLWMLNNKTAEESVAGVIPGKSTIKNPVPGHKPETKEALAATGDNKQEQDINSAPDARNTTDITNNTATGAQKNAKNTLPLNNNLQQQDKNDAVATQQPDKKKGNNLPEPVYNPNVNNSNEAILAVNPVSSNNNAKGILTKQDVTNNNTSSPNIKPGIDFAVAKDDPTIGGAEDESGGRKNKLRGFFRKVTRTFEKRTNIDPTDNDNRLLVGGLAIKLK